MVFGRDLGFGVEFHSKGNRSCFSSCLYTSNRRYFASAKSVLVRRDTQYKNVTTKHAQMSVHDAQSICKCPKKDDQQCFSLC